MTSTNVKPSLPQIYTYTIDGVQNKHIVERAHEYLRPHLPASLLLYRRLQFGRFFSSTRLLASIDLETPASTSTTSADGSSITNPPEPWLIAFVDRSCRPETELWVYGSWETDDDNDDKHPPEYQAAAENLVLALVRTINTLETPVSIHQNVLDSQAKAAAAMTATSQSEYRDAAGLTRADYSSHMANSRIMLWGAVNEQTTRIVHRLGLLGSEYHETGSSNYSFLWDVDTLLHDNNDERVKRNLIELPQGLRWGELQVEHFALVRSRTGIPRQDKTLAALANVAIFEGSAPIAWGFVGLDTSLTTLHVEEGYRRKGLAQSLTIKLFREKMDRFREPGLTHWALGHVVYGNEASARMCSSIGGRHGAKAYWLRVYLDNI